MFDKFKRHKRPLRVLVAPKKNIPKIVTQDEHMTSFVDYPDRVATESQKKNMIFSLRRKSKTEPAIVLSKYQKKNSRNQDGVIEDGKAVEDSKQMKTTISSEVVSKHRAFPGEVESVILAGTIGSIASFSSSKLFSSMVDDAEKVDVDIFNNFEFPLRNLVFEGGGNKGMAYVGAIQV